MSDRIESMKQFVQQYPENAFPRYALAMEYKAAGRVDEAIAALAALAERLPDYVPTYLQYGMLLSEAERVAEARTVLERGIEVARAAGDRHAQSEMEGTLAGLD